MQLASVSKLLTRTGKTFLRKVLIEESRYVATPLVPRVFDYYTKLDFSPAHKIHKIHALRMVSASSALSSVFCYRGLEAFEC